MHSDRSVRSMFEISLLLQYHRGVSGVVVKYVCVREREGESVCVCAGGDGRDGTCVKVIVSLAWSM